MNVSLARALKEKARIARKLNRNMELIAAENSKREGSPRTVDVAGLFAEAGALKTRLVELKTAIAVANHYIVGRMAELDETKSMIARLNAVDTDDGIENHFSHLGVQEYRNEVILSKSDILKEVEILQARADELQDMLDEYNANTTVEI